MSQRIRAPNRDRAQLLGVTPPSSGRSSPYDDAHNRRPTPSYEYSNTTHNSYSSSSSSTAQYSQPQGQRFADDLEGQNDEHLEGLSAKVKMLKDITIGIGNEVRDSTKQLTQMNDAFAETSGILAGTFRRMNNMASRQGCRWLWYVVFLVIVFWFFLVVWFLRR